MKRLTLGVDFDSTLVSEVYPEIGKLFPGARTWLNKLFDDGHYIIIWTCRCEKYQLEVEQFLFENNVHYHKINDNEPSRILKFDNMNCRKISCDLYIDDKSLLGLPMKNGVPDWSSIYKLVTQKAKQNE